MSDMSESKTPLRVTIIGTAKRSEYLYGPLLRALPHVELVAVWGRSEASAQRLGESLHVPHFTDLERLTRETAPQIGIVSVAYGANGEVGLMAVEHGLHVLLETPIAHKLEEADAIIAAAQARNLKIEVAEQFHRRPMEQIKLKLLASGLFGRVHTAFNDFAGHGYHGVSVLRSYIGFDEKITQVTGRVQKYPLGAYWSRLENKHAARNETQEHAILEFEGGQTGIYHWTSVAYDSPLRWWRSSRFLAEKGMGVTTGVYPDLQEHISLLTPGEEAPRFLRIERRYERVDGGALIAVVAHTGDPALPLVQWENPFRAEKPGHAPQWHDDEIGVVGCIQSLVDAVRNDTQPSYGALQARLDQEVVLALRQSSEQGGLSVSLPLVV